MGQTLQIVLLGDFRVVYGEDAVTTLSGDRLQPLVTYLLLNRQAPQPRHHIAFQIWPDSNESQARTNLRNLLHTLRNALPDADTFLDVNNITLQWKPDAPYRLDVADFQAALAQAKDAPTPQIKADALRQAVAFYQGDLLPGNYDDWIVVLREELRQQFAQGLLRLIHLCEASGDLREAMHYTQRLLSEDPLNENSYVIFMRLYALNGDRAGVRRIYEQCVATLQRELNVEPSAATQAAYEQLLRMEAPATPQPMPALTPVPVPTPKRRLSPPRLATPFLGREAELAELAQMLADPHCRLLTIVGPGGMGKTYLAQQTASGHAAIYADGAAFVSLAPIANASLLASTIASTLGITFQGAEAPDVQLLAALADAEMLIVLDNFEHLLAGADLLSALLASAPHVKLLVTSRERLNLQEEWVYDLQGLPLPAEDDPDWQESSSVQLFVQNARKADASFALTEADRVPLIQICRLVEGMPLGIQLAAAWVRVLALPEIAAELERNIEFLQTSYRNVPERHRSLRAVFDHSWQLLTPEEQAVLRKLALFHGGFDRTLAEQVAGATLAVLSTLVDKSLVRRHAEGRYSLHELIRQYAESALRTAGEWQDGRARHLRAYAAMIDDMADRLYGAIQSALFAQLELDQDNLRSALS